MSHKDQQNQNIKSSNRQNMQSSNNQQGMQSSNSQQQGMQSSARQGMQSSSQQDMSSSSKQSTQSSAGSQLQSEAYRTGFMASGSTQSSSMRSSQPNQSIQCTVKQCSHHCQDQNYCSLSSITVGTHEPNPTVIECTDCQSFKC